MHMFHIPQCIIQNRNVHISVLNDALWDMEQMHCEICELGQLFTRETEARIVYCEYFRQHWYVWDIATKC